MTAQRKATTAARNVSHYSILIEWSIMDQAYVVTLPEWERAGYSAHTHGATYAKAAQKGQELLDFLISTTEQDGDSLPEPAIFDTHFYELGDTQESLARENEELARRIEQMDARQAAQGKSA